MTFADGTVQEFSTFEDMLSHGVQIVTLDSTPTVEVLIDDDKYIDSVVEFTLRTMSVEEESFYIDTIV